MGSRYMENGCAFKVHGFVFSGDNEGQILSVLVTELINEL